MKKLTLLFFSLNLLFISSCKDDDVEPADPNDSLVEYFRCNINGEPFQALSSFNCEGLLFDYYPEAAFGTDERYMVLSGRDCYNSQNVAIRFFNFNYNGENTIDFLAVNQADSVSPGYLYRVDGNPIEVDNLISGNLVFSRFEPRTDEKLGTVEGTFEFTVTNETQDSVFHVTDGEFRYRVQHTW